MLCEGLRGDKQTEEEERLQDGFLTENQRNEALKYEQEFASTKEGDTQSGQRQQSTRR